MGLDNGIYIKGYRKKPFYVKDDLYDQSNQIDLAYWRKYWGLRNDIINIIYENYYGNDSEVLLSENQIKKIRNLIMEITFSKKRYLESCSGYWDYNIYSWQSKNYLSKKLRPRQIAYHVPRASLHLRCAKPILR